MSKCNYILTNSLMAVSYSGYSVINHHLFRYRNQGPLRDKGF